jgi:hypothetical protein
VEEVMDTAGTAGTATMVAMVATVGTVGATDASQFALPEDLALMAMAMVCMVASTMAGMVTTLPIMHLIIIINNYKIYDVE